MSQPFNQQAASLVEETVGLIKQVLIKHSTAVLEEMYEQITSRNERIRQLEKENYAMMSDTNEYCEVLRVLGMEEDGSPVEEILEREKITDALRELLLVEFLRHDHLELPWNCAESDCPRFGKSLYLTGCNCVNEFKAKHVAAVKKELGL